MILLLAMLAAPERDAARSLADLMSRVAERRGVPQLNEAPEWARDRGEPLATIGIVADVHWHPGRDAAYIERAVAFLNERGPQVVLFLGDTVWTDGDFEAAHREARGILDALEPPYYVVKGDNDARGHEAVWGAAQFSFDLGGVRFAAMGMTRDWDGVGAGYYDELEWLRQTLDVDGPAVVLTHVPVQPGLLALGNGELARTMREAGNVAANLAGHLHLDLEWAETDPPCLAAPGLGVTEGAPLKIGSIYEDGIVLETYRVEGDAYVHDRRWQFVRFGLPARGGGLENFTEGSAAPTEFLEDRGPLEEYLRRLFGR